MNRPHPEQAKLERCPVIASETSLPTLSRKSIRTPRRLIAFFGFVLLVTLIFSRQLLSLFRHAASSELHSYVFFIPLVSAYLIYNRRKELPSDYSSAYGLAMVGLGIGGGALAAMGMSRMHLLPLSENDYLSLFALAFVCFLVAGGFLFVGRKWMAAAAFPFAFLLFFVPMPDVVRDWLETGSKLASADVANALFVLTGTPTLRDGTLFQLPGIVIHVAQECSGIRSSWVLFITSILAAHLFLKEPWRRVLLVGAVIPLGILRNGLRILVIALLCVHFGPEMISSVFHKHGGPLFFALSLIPLFFLLWWLRRGDHAPNSK
jgi:exosortase C (VPDSG-CTERM-specific)